MADLSAIQSLLYRYCYAHDSQDLEMLGTCFTEDVEFVGTKGRDAVLAAYGAGYAHMSSKRRHVLTNVFLLEDGEDEALACSYVTLYLIKGEELEVHLTGVYHDRVVREDGQWKLRSRTAMMDVPYRPGDAPSAAPGTYPPR